ncbi:glutathione synthetase-like isoform X2 [Hylaeus volcanicus]|nr:glutathione synthetase-like isoform X2 [Hylaeus volcanicus]XP_053991266.1 glutathione synthetase-like isoform X2 [Hylaeus volcanicus]
MDFIKKTYSEIYHASSHQSNTYDLLLKDLVDYATRWAWTNGLCFIKNPPSLKSTYLIPFSLLPSLIPKKSFYQGEIASRLYTELLTKLLYYPEYLEILHEIENGPGEEFIYQLVTIAKRCYGSEPFQRKLSDDILFGVFRSDYLLSSSDEIPLAQVEINTISVSYGSIACKLESYYRNVLRKLFGSRDRDEFHLPSNSALSSTVSSMKNVYDMYIEKHKNNIVDNCLPAVLFVVSDKEKNQMDQNFLQIYLEALQVPVLRKSFAELCYMVTKTTCEGFPYLSLIPLNVNSISPTLIDLNSPFSPGRLILYDIKQFYEIALIYYRTGYDPSDYSCDHHKCWKLRELFEFSDAIKCPNVYHQLSGFKKMQSKWLNFIHVLRSPDIDKATKILTSVAVDHVNLSDYSSSEKTRKVVAEALKNPNNFVLKSQQEGGSEILYGSECLDILKHCQDFGCESSSEKSCYCLMRFIHSDQHQSISISSAESITVKERTVSELGFFTTTISSQNGLCEVKSAGHLLRTKEAHLRSGGVTIGSAFLDYPLLY